jgi:ribonuclease III
VSATPPEEASAVPEPIREAVEAALGYRFRTPDLLALGLGALRLPLTPETALQRQRLEFLGDAAWNYALALCLFQAQPEAAAGELTRQRAAWSSTAGLARLARGMGLPTPEGYAQPGPSDRVLAEMLEALLGAVVQDGGLAPVRTLAARVLSGEIVTSAGPPVDAKSALQMLIQSRTGRLPAYRLLGRWGAPHHPTFRVQAAAPGPDGERTAEAEGPSRQTAEQEAARLLLADLDAPPEDCHNIS